MRRFRESFVCIIDVVWEDRKAEVIKLPCLPVPKGNFRCVVNLEGFQHPVWSRRGRRWHAFGDRKGQETVHQVRHDPAQLERSLSAVVGNRSAIWQLGPIASTGRSTGINVLAPKNTPFVARAARAPKSTGIGERGVGEWKGGWSKSGPVHGHGCIFGGPGGAGAQPEGGTSPCGHPTGPAVEGEIERPQRTRENVLVIKRLFWSVDWEKVCCDPHSESYELPGRSVSSSSVYRR